MLAWGPVNDTEHALESALQDGDEARAQLVIRMADLIIPSMTANDTRWPIVSDDEGRRWVFTFTSEELWKSCAGPHAARARTISMLQLASRWPDNTIGLSVNPDTNLAIALEPKAYAGLVSPRLDQLMALYPDGTIPILQKPLTGDEMTEILTGEVGAISGYVHLVDEVVDIDSPSLLLDTVGIRDHEMVDYVFDDNSIHLLQWPALGLDLYRTPLGGRDEQQRDAVGGWVIAPEPFIGMGLTSPRSGGGVHEYHCSGVAPPHGSAVIEMTADGERIRRAVYDAAAGGWRRILKHTSDDTSVGPDVHMGREHTGDL